MAAINMRLSAILFLLRAVKDALLPHWKKLKADDKAELADTIYHVDKAKESLWAFINKRKVRQKNETA